MARREAVKLRLYRDAGRSLTSGPRSYSSERVSIDSFAVLHTDTSLDDMLDKKFPLKWTPEFLFDLDANNRYSYAAKVKSEITGLCLACMRDRKHEKRNICFF